MLKTENIVKSFNIVCDAKKMTILPLDGVSLSVDKGERVGIIGKSGAGKSTLARVICGFTKPDKGNVFIDGKPLYDAKGAYDRRNGIKIQLIPQQPFQSLDKTQTAYGAVLEAVRIARKTSRAQAEQIARELLNRVELDFSLKDRLPFQLSGGQAQRVAIARALAVAPSVIIADEATAMLDACTQAQIITLLSQLSREDGLSVILVSHDEKLIRAFADSKYILADGRLTAYGEAEKEKNEKNI